MTETTQRSLISFTQLDQYLRCPLKYRFIYIDRIDPEFVPASLIFGRGIHVAAAHYFRGVAAGARPTVADVQGVFATYWDLETSLRPVKFWKGSKAESLDQAAQMLAVFHAAQDPTIEVIAVEQRFTVPLIDQTTGEVLDPELVVVLDLLERDREGRLVVVDLKTVWRSCETRRPCALIAEDSRDAGSGAARWSGRRRSSSPHAASGDRASDRARSRRRDAARVGQPVLHLRRIGAPGASCAGEARTSMTSRTGPEHAVCDAVRPARRPVVYLASTP
jgi:hypothetical protein